jgi:cation diffusion facilitator family transporter
MKRVSAAKAVTTSFFVDMADIVMNIIVMIVTGSVVLLAEAFEGASDLAASGVLLIGLRVSKRRPNKKHPFGYGKALFFWTLISAIIMLFFGAGLSIYFGLQRFIHPEEVSNIVLAYAALGISIITNGYALSLSSRRLLGKEHWKKIVSVFFESVHVETKNTFILDLTGTSAAIIGLISLLLYQLAALQQFDGIGAMLIGSLVAISSVVLIWGVKDYLIGKTASAELQDTIRQTALEVKHVVKVVKIETMYIGSEKLLVHLTVQIQTANGGSVATIVEEIKERIKQEVRIVYFIQIETQTQ